MEYPSKLVENAVEQIAKLPGIGKKTALRLVLQILKEDQDFSLDLSSAIVELRTKIVYCDNCYSIADSPKCHICSSSKRDESVICVVQDTKDVLAIENTNQYRGMYHVLGGIISPIDGIGPDDLKIDSLISRVQAESTKEIILAISPTMEGDTTSYYITKKLAPFGVKVSTIARGVPIGGELEYADEVTLGRSIMTRTVYQISES